MVVSGEWIVRRGVLEPHGGFLGGSCEPCLTSSATTWCLIDFSTPLGGK